MKYKPYFQKHIYRAKINHSVRHTNILDFLSKDQGNVSLFKEVQIYCLVLGSLPYTPFSPRTEKGLNRPFRLLPKPEYP